jgi:hypothetical protein
LFTGIPKLTEGLIKFEPTMKSQSRGSMSSWDSRILWIKSPLISQINYQSMPSLTPGLSQPVQATFEISGKKIGKKEEMKVMGQQFSMERFQTQRFEEEKADVNKALKNLI